MFHIMKCETMENELLNHKQTKDYSHDEISYFAKIATIPENYDTIICYIEQNDDKNSVLYTKKMFACLAQSEGCTFDDVAIYTNMTNAIVDIFKHHVMDVSTFVNVTPEINNLYDAIDALLHMKEFVVTEDESICELTVEEPSDNEEPDDKDDSIENDESDNNEESDDKDDSIENDESDNNEEPDDKDDFIENDESDNSDDDDASPNQINRKDLIITQLNINRKNKLIGKKYELYIDRAVVIYNDIENRLLKGDTNKQIYTLFGDDYRRKKYMDSIILSIKQILTNCNDISCSDTEEPSSVGEQISNHINGFSMKRNIISPMSDISYAVKQHMVATSIKHINTIESFTSTIDNPFVQIYVNQTLRDMRDKCAAHM